MYSFSCEFYPTNSTDVDTIEHRLLSYGAALHSNGQILADWDLVQLETSFQLLGIMPAEDSLATKYHNEYCTEAYQKALQASLRDPTCQMIGRSVGLDPSCTCAAPSFYVLETTCINPEPPVICGDCGLRVPLYRLPYPRDAKDYYTVLSWQATYQACDELYLLSGVGERFGRRQTCGSKSRLTAEGMRICEEYAQRLQKPFYYSLCGEHRGGLCPLCGHPWSRETELENVFNVSCSRCGIVAYDGK